MLETGRFFADSNRLQELNFKQDDPGSLKTVAKEFESLFLQQLLTSMRESQKALKSNVFDSNAMDSYEEMYDKQMALELANNKGIGLADVIVKQMQPQSQIQTQAQDNKINNKTLLMPQRQAVVNKYSNNSLLEKETKTETKTETEKPVEKSAKNLDPSSKFNSPEDFIKKLLPTALNIATKMSIDPKLLIAQSALETGWGNKIAQMPNGDSSNNLFGIKAGGTWDGQKVSATTTEYKNGIIQRDKAKFRAYASVADSMQDYVNFIKDNPRYNQAMQNSDDPKKYMHALQKAGYATDPNYADNIMRLYSKVKELI